MTKNTDKSEKIDCILTISGLSALVYGGYQIYDFPFRNWIEDVQSNSDSFQKLKDLFPYA